MDGFEAAGASWSKSDIRAESSPWEGRQISLLQPLAATVLLSLGFSAHLGDSWTVSQASHLSSLAGGKKGIAFPVSFSSHSFSYLVPSLPSVFFRHNRKLQPPAEKPDFLEVIFSCLPECHFLEDDT